MGTRTCCVAGHLTSEEPKGTYIKVGGVDAYLAKPKAGTDYKGRAVLLLTDVFGYKLPNAQVVADAIAEAGDFLVLIPDLFNHKEVPFWLMEKVVTVSGFGQPKPTTWAETVSTKLQSAAIIAQLSWYFVPFLLTQGRCSSKMSLLEAVIADMKAVHGVTKIGTIGFCYGGTGCIALAKLPDKVDAFAVAHGEVKVPDDIEQVQKPGLFLCAEKDMAFSDPAVAKAKELLAKRPDAKNFQLKYYPGTFHGFAIRGDEKDETVKKAKDDAIQTAVNFFKEHLKA